jgi:nicotinamidase-related amidase
MNLDPDDQTRPVPHVDPRELAAMITAAQCALLVIDVQEDFASPAGAMARGGADLSGVPAALANIRRLISAARAAGVAVAFARVVTTPATDSAALKRLSARKGEAADAIAICRKGQRGCAYYGVAPEPDDIEVEKRLYDAFHDTDLEAQFRRRGVETLIVAGLTTHCCVDATCRAAFHRGFDVFVVSDAADAYSPAAHWAALRSLRTSCALVVDTPSMLAAWRG